LDDELLKERWLVLKRGGAMEKLYIGELKGTPIGDLWLAVSDLGLAAVEWGQSQAEFEAWLVKRFKRTVEHKPKRVAQAASELREYLKGKRRHFTLIIDWTLLRPFQQAVLKATYEIPYGETRAYKEISEQIGRPHAARAVGRAEATNPMPLVIPCHRVIGTDNKLHGYGLGEGLKTKEWLLKLEGAVLT
jgi:methylated-DNA-[protein]-cysteine S-methyltransferase